ncbi:glycosyltransferase family 4 protein [Brevibacillus invocatus]|nr:glycosyltransferase family 4 protein [Brevibacillus invocatus]
MKKTKDRRAGKAMKILLSAFACEPDRGSEPGFGWNCAIELARQGNEVWVLTRPEGRRAIEERLSRESLPHLHFVIVDDFPQIRKVIKGNSGYFLNYFYWQYQAYRTAKRLEKEVSFDIIHHITLGSLQGGSWLWRLGKPMVFGPVGGGQTAPEAFKQYFGGEWRQEAARSLFRCRMAAWNPVLRGTIRHASATLATNQDTLAIARGMGGKNLSLFLDTSLPHDFFPDNLPQRKADTSLKLLWVGRLMPRKALQIALEAVAKVNPELSIKLCIVGGGQLESHVEKWIQQYEVEDRVEFHGQLPWEQVKQHYLTSDVFLFTSLRDSFGAQVLEAMAYGLPVIVLDHHGVRDFVPTTAGIKIPVTSPEQVTSDMAAAIEALYRQPEERARMGCAGYDFAKEHTWESFGKKMEHVYREIQPW